MKATIVFKKIWDAINVGCPEPHISESECEICHNTGKRYRYIILEGSSRSSKTISLIQLYDLLARSKENKRLTVWRDTKIDCKKTVLVDYLKTLRREGKYLKNHDFNKTESIFYYETGSTVEIHGTDDEESVHGLTQDYAWLNEPYKISEQTFNQIDQRTADFVFIDYNPKSSHWVENLKKNKRAILIKSTFKDNPFCPPEMRAKILSYQPVSMTEVVLGGLISEKEAVDYDIIANSRNFESKQIKELSRCQQNEEQRSASKFDWEVYGLGNKSEKKNRIFSWKEIDYAEYEKIQATKYIGVDWGTADPFAIAEVKYYDGKLYVHELNYDSENRIREKLTPEQRQQLRGSTEEEKEITLVNWLFGQLKIDKSLDIICDINRPLKIAGLRRAGYYNATGANKPKGSIIDGITLLQSLDVYYTHTSVNIAYEQEVYSWKTDRFGDVQEIPEDKDNHMCDCIRYAALFLSSKGILRHV